MWTELVVRRGSGDGSLNKLKGDVFCLFVCCCFIVVVCLFVSLLLLLFVCLFVLLLLFVCFSFGCVTCASFKTEIVLIELKFDPVRCFSSVVHFTFLTGWAQEPPSHVGVWTCRRRNAVPQATVLLFQLSGSLRMRCTGGHMRWGPIVYRIHWG